MLRPSLTLSRRQRLTRAVARALLVAVAANSVCAQTSPAYGPLPPTSEVPLSDYLGLLQQMAPAAAEGARSYLAAYQLQCRRTLSTFELRLAMSKDGGDPVLMGLIRAAQERDPVLRAQWVGKVRCAVGAKP